MTKKKQPLSVKSVRSINMSDFNYMHVHRFMFIIFEKDGPYIHLMQDGYSPVSIPVSKELAESFLNYEIPFKDMVMLMQALCIKFGKNDVPF